MFQIIETLIVSIIETLLKITAYLELFINGLYARHCTPAANNESSEVFDIIKPGRRVKIKGYRQ